MLVVGTGVEAGSVSSVEGLRLVELGVQAVQRDQFPVHALLDNLAVLEHQDAVGILHRGQAMGDHQGGATAAQSLPAWRAMCVSTPPMPPIRSSRSRW